MSSRMSIDKYKYWKASAYNIIALRPINETLIIVTNAKLLYVTDRKPLIYRQPMYNI